MEGTAPINFVVAGPIRSGARLFRTYASSVTPTGGRPLP